MGGAIEAALTVKVGTTSADVGALTAAVGAFDVDVGALDVGAPDAGALDVGAPDVGALDVGALDVGAPDVGAPDVGAPDDDVGARVTSPRRAATGALKMKGGGVRAGSSKSGVRPRLPTRLDAARRSGDDGSEESDWLSVDTSSPRSCRRRAVRLRVVAAEEALEISTIAGSGFGARADAAAG